jgi:Zinc knuckle
MHRFSPSSRQDDLIPVRHDELPQAHRQEEHRHHSSRSDRSREAPPLYAHRDESRGERDSGSGRRYASPANSRYRQSGGGEVALGKRERSPPRTRAHPSISLRDRARLPPPREHSRYERPLLPPSVGAGGRRDAQPQCLVCKGMGHYAAACTSSEYAVRSAPPNSECYGCGGLGHIKARCPTVLGALQCHWCGQPGHRIANCPQRNGAPPPMPHLGGRMPPYAHPFGMPPPGHAPHHPFDAAAAMHYAQPPVHHHFPERSRRRLDSPPRHGHHQYHHPSQIAPREPYLSPRPRSPLRRPRSPPRRPRSPPRRARSRSRSRSPLPVARSRSPLPVARSRSPLPVTRSRSPLPVSRSLSPLSAAAYDRAPSSRRPPSPRLRDRDLCYNCWQPGHRARDCINAKGAPLCFVCKRPVGVSATPSARSLCSLGCHFA